MVKTLISIFITLGLLVGISAYELYHVKETFAIFHEALESLYYKTENERASHEDGKIVRKIWVREKRDLHIWIPHNAIENLDFHLSEALGYLYEGQFTDALPKIEVLIDMAENIPHAFEFNIQNIL